MTDNSTLAWLDADPLRELNALKLERLAAGDEVLDLSMINPDLTPARFLLDKLLEATVRATNHRYAVARGVRKLRDAFAEKYRTAWNVSVNPEREVCVTMGSKDAIEHTLLALDARGRSVLVGAPTYPAFLSAIKLAGLEPRYFQISADEDAMIAEITERMTCDNPRAVLLNFPNNPTGRTVTKNFYERLIELAQRHDVFVINDFVYGEMQFGGRPAVSLLQVAGASAHAAEIYSLSKAYSVPGWRVGALVGNEDLVRKLAQLKAHIDYGIFLPIQHAAAAALTQKPPVALAVTENYAARYALLSSGLAKLGWEVCPASAGCCVWAALPDNVRSAGSFAIARRLLLEAGIVMLPGSVFGAGYKNWARFALVAPEPKLRTVLDRIAAWSAHQSVVAPLAEASA